MSSFDQKTKSWSFHYFFLNEIFICKIDLLDRLVDLLISKIIQIVLIDEATAHLDSISHDRMLGLIKVSIDDTGVHSRAFLWFLLILSSRTLAVTFSWALYPHISTRCARNGMITRYHEECRNSRLF